MIEQTVEELTPHIRTLPACRALGASPATIYRRRTPPERAPTRARPTPVRALSAFERVEVLGELHSERFVDSAPEQVCEAYDMFVGLMTESGKSAAQVSLRR